MRIHYFLCLEVITVKAIKVQSILKAAVAYKVICFLLDYIDYANFWRTSNNERLTRIKRPLSGTPGVGAGGSKTRGGIKVDGIAVLSFFSNGI